jgi:hypothetical protein
MAWRRTKAFIAAHREALARMVLEIHLEHAANEVAAGADGALVTTGLRKRAGGSRPGSLAHPRARRARGHRGGAARPLARAEASDVFGPHPTTDGGFFHLRAAARELSHGAPLLLFDAMTPLTRSIAQSLVPGDACAPYW